MKRLIIFFALVLGLLVGGLFGLRWWVTQTESGARYLFGKLTEVVPGVSVARLDGTLDEGLRLGGLSWRAGAQSVDVAAIELRAGVRFLPRPAVTVRRLHIDGVTALLPPADEPGEPLGLPTIASPVPVRVDDLRIRALSLATATGTEPYVVPEINAKLIYAGTLELRSLQARYRDLGLDAQGRIDLAPPYEHELTLQLQAGPAVPAPLTPEFRLDAGSSGSLDRLIANLQTRGNWPLALQLDATALMDAPQWRLRLNSQTLAWPGGGTRVALRDLRVRAEGGLDDATGRIDVDLQAPRQLAGDWSLAFARRGPELLLRELSGPLLAGSLRAEGRLDTAADQPRGAVAVRLEGVKPADGNLPAGVAGVAGELQLGLEGSQLTLERMDLTVPGSAWKAAGSGRYSLDTGRAELALDWHDITWPPGGTEAPQFASPSGSLRLQGDPAAYELSLRSEVSGDSFPAAVLQLEGRGSTEQVTLDALRLETLDGRLNGQAVIELAPRLRWQASLEGESLDPGAYWPAFPGQLSFAATSDGGRERDAWRAALELNELSGELRGRPVSGSGRITYRGGELHTDGLTIESASARLQVREDESALVADLDVADLSDLLPAARGRIEAETRVVRSPPVRVEVGLAADGLQYRGWSLERIEGSGFWQAGDALRARAGLLATALTTPGGRGLGTVEVALDSAASGQRLRVDAREGELQLALQAGGGFDRWPAPRRWRGTLDELRLDNQRFGAWALAQAATLEWREGRIESEPLCLAQAAGVGRICASGAGNAAAGHALLELQQLPLRFAGQLVEPALRLDSTLGGRVDAAWNAGLQRLDSQLEVTPGNVSIAGEQTPPLRLTGARLSSHIDQASRLHTSGELHLENGNRMGGEVILGPLEAVGSPAVSGSVGLNIEQMQVLRRVIPELDDLGGSLDLDVRLGGTFAEPTWRPRFTLRDGRLRYAPLGLQMSELSLDGETEAGERLRLTGGFRAGDGRGELGGHLDPGSGVARIELSGDRLRLLDSEVYQLTATPGLAVAYDDGQVTIDGRIDIPSALIKPASLGTQVVTASPDVVVAGRQQDNAAGAAADVEFRGDLTIALGADVRVDMDLARARLAGELGLHWSGSPLPTGDGEIRMVSGGVRAYGQALDLKRGRVLFASVPVNNPRLDIRAARDIFSDPQVTEAGVAVTGTAQQPEVAVYTEPPTNRESALAYLVTGNNFDHANGEGALNVGLYLLPKFFVSYGFGLFDNGDVVSARYDLDDDWSVRAQSGARDTGVDIGWRGDG